MSDMKRTTWKRNAERIWLLVSILLVVWGGTLFLLPRYEHSLDGWS